MWAMHKVALAALQVVGRRLLLQQGLVVHGGRRPPGPAWFPLAPPLPFGLGSGLDSGGLPDARRRIFPRGGCGVRKWWYRKMAWPKPQNQEMEGNEGNGEDVLEF